MNKKNFKIFLEEIFSENWKYGITVLNLGILISFCLISYYNLSKGVVMSPDSYSYSRWADELIKLNFNFIAFYKDGSFIAPKYLYTIPVIFVAFSKLFFGTGWQIAFMCLNLVFILFSLILFSKSLLLLKVRPFAIAFAMPILALSVDLLLWPKYILTDTIFSCFVIFLIFFIIKSLVKNNFLFFYLSIFLLLIIFSRPSSMPYLSSVLVFFLFLRIKAIFNPKIILLIFILIFLLTPLIFSILFHLMEFYLSGNPRVNYIVEAVKEGIVIRHRPHTYLDSPSSILDVIILYFVRLIYFFSPHTKNFSTIHTLLNSLQAVIIFFSIFIWSFMGSKYELINKTIALILLMSIFVAAFHSFLIIDYDWRFRFPIIMPLLLIFPLSFEILLKKIYYKKNR